VLHVKDSASVIIIAVLISSFLKLRRSESRNGTGKAATLRRASGQKKANPDKVRDTDTL
jgi:hypothetical protein